MRTWLVAASAVLALTACSRTISVHSGRPAAAVVAKSGRGAGPRSVGHIPPGHYPPPGQCRVWYVGRPPGRQPRAARCDRLGPVPAGAFVLYNSKAWDTDYDWARHARRNPGSVPDIVLRVMLKVKR